MNGTERMNDIRKLKISTNQSRSTYQLEAVSTAVDLSAPDFIAAAFTKRVTSRNRVSTMVGSTAMLASMRMEQ